MTFPRLVRRIDRKHELFAWVGDDERLGRLIRLLEGLVDKAPDKTPQTPADAVLEAAGRTPGPVALIATAKERGALTLRGTPNDVFAEMDRTALQSLELEVASTTQPAKRDRVSISFEMIEGVVLESRGETDWVAETHTDLVEELDRGKPWWEWLRGPLGWLLFEVLLIAIAWTLSDSPRFHESGEPTLGGRIGTTFMLAMLGGFVAAGMVMVVRRILPGFEVVLPGETGRGARALGVIGTVLLAAAGFLVPLVVD